MSSKGYLKRLVEDIHSAIVATIGADGHPQTRVIDMMLLDEQGVYFLTAKGKAFYRQLMEQRYIALSATKDKISVSLRGKIKNIGNEKLDEIFEKNSYMKAIYQGEKIRRRPMSASTLEKPMRRRISGNARFALMAISGKFCTSCERRLQNSLTWIIIL